MNAHDLIPPFLPPSLPFLLLQLFRISTFGESHGGGVGVVVDGCPPRVQITREEIQQELDRRRLVLPPSLLGFFPSPPSLLPSLRATLYSLLSSRPKVYGLHELPPPPSLPPSLPPPLPPPPPPPPLFLSWVKIN